jgi:hypothetical protein
MNKLEWQRKYRQKTGNACTKKYEKTPKGYLVRKYRNMLSRVNGIQKEKAHLYKGLDILPKEDFYNWALSSEEYHKLFSQYENSKYDRRLAPTVDRIDSSKGYTMDNMRWLTHSENSKLGNQSRWQNQIKKNALV